MTTQSHPLLTLTISTVGVIEPRRAVRYDGARAGAGEKVLGVARTAPESNGLVGVDSIGTTAVETGAAVGVGVGLVSDGEGRAIPATGATGEHIFADAMEAASGAGAVIEIRLR